MPLSGGLGASDLTGGDTEHVGASALLVAVDSVAAPGQTFSETLTEGFTASDSPTQTLPQILRPDGDVSVGSWTDEGGATSNLFQSIDEVDANDADYVEGP